jgi:hypothetical protein
MPQAAAVFPSAFISLSLRPFLLVRGIVPLFFLRCYVAFYCEQFFPDHHSRHANVVIAVVNIDTFLRTLLFIDEYEIDFASEIFRIL